MTDGLIFILILVICFFGIAFWIELADIARAIYHLADKEVLEDRLKEAKNEQRF